MMPRYYFHHHGYSDALDASGIDIADDWDAMKHARECARHIAAANVWEGSLDLNHFVMCVDKTERLVGVARFGDVVKVAPMID